MEPSENKQQDTAKKYHTNQENTVLRGREKSGEKTEATTWKIIR